MPEGTYQAPEVSNENLTPRFVYEELLHCFESANREFYRILNQPITDEVLRQQVRQFVTNVFSQCQVDPAAPSKQGILLAIDQCRQKAGEMMGERGAGIIRHHYDEMMKLVTRLPED